MSMINWTNQERDVGMLIVDMLEERDPTGNIEFNPINIYWHYRDRFSYLWPNSGIPSSVIHCFRSLKKKKELIQEKGDYYPYRLSKNGCLFLLLSLRVRHKKAEQAVPNGETHTE